MNLLGLASIADVFWGRKPMIGAIGSSPFNASFTLRFVRRIFVQIDDQNEDGDGVGNGNSSFTCVDKFRFVFVDFIFQKGLACSTLAH